MIKNICIAALCLLFWNCKPDKGRSFYESKTDSQLQPATTVQDKSSVPIKELKYVTATSGLNYRKKPKGDVLGKLLFNQEVEVVEHTNIIEKIVDDNMTVTGEWIGILIDHEAVYVFDAYLSNKPSVPDIWSKFPIKNPPFSDTTNFNNVTLKNPLNLEVITALQLHKLYSINEYEKGHFKFYPSYQLKKDGRKTIILNVLKGDHEIESIFIPYNENNEIIEIYHEEEEEEEENMIYTNALVIAYDEIAEGYTRKKSRITKDCITVIDEISLDQPIIDTTLYHINDLNIINQVNLELSNNIRPRKKLQLHTIYTDTVQFVKYNNDYDVFYIEGKKHGKPVSLIYSWDVDQSKNFQKNDKIKITWKIDSLFTAGDGETLSFSEFAIDAVSL